MRILMGSDHGAFALKNEIAERLRADGHEVVDYGSHDGTSCDYPDRATEVCRDLLAGQGDWAILLCGTGIGISMAANKVKGIRAALAHDCFSARMARCHNNANVLCLGGRVIGPELAYEIVQAFMRAEFEGGRHQRRVDKIMAIED